MQDPSRASTRRNQNELLRAVELHATTPLPYRTVSEQREQVLKEEKEREADRQHRLASQSSPMRAPDDRIRIWEQLHGLQLPRKPDHKLVDVIASQTGLSSTEVRAEQARRLQPAIVT